MTTKDEAISRAYYDLAGFGSINSTLEDALKFNPDITYDDVKQWKQRNVERKTNLKGFNSFIAEKPFEEFQIDLFFTPDFFFCKSTHSYPSTKFSTEILGKMNLIFIKLNVNLKNSYRIKHV